MRIFTLFLMSVFGATAFAQAALAQDDPNLRNPTIYVVEQEDAISHYVVGDEAWGNVVVTLGMLRNQGPEQDQAIADQLWERRDTNPPIFLYEITRRVSDTDPVRALEAYFLARGRILYDVTRCLDTSALSVVDAAAVFAGDDLVELMQSDPARLEASLANVYNGGQLYTSQASPWWACSYGDSAYIAATNEAPMPGNQWLKTEIRWQESRNVVGQQTLYMLELIRAGIAAQNE